MPETVRDTLTAAFGAAFSAALAGEPLLRRTASPKAEARRLARAEEQLRMPERFSSVRGTGRSAVLSAAAASAVRGSGLGLLGIGLPDIPLFAASLLRSLGQIARGYGYITSTRRERRIMLLVLDTALTGGMEYPALSDQLDQALSGTELTGFSEQELADRVAGKLAEELSDGYQQYAQQNGTPDPSRMGDRFIDYLGTADGQSRLAEGLEGTVDAAGLEKQISAAMEDYMGKIMTSYGSSIGQAMETQITSVMRQIMSRLASGMSEAFGEAMTEIGRALQDAMQIDADAFADAFEMNMTGEEFTELMMSMSSGQSASYDNNLRTLGYVDFDEPSGINIYPKDFESKEAVVAILDDYNTRMEEEGQDEKVITYTDVVGTLMSSVTTIIDIISYVLIAFVAISLVVSSIMIGVITYISVLERRKEIGILRAIGASKKNISQVFNAETFIIGLCAGVLGILISLLLLIPGNALIHYLAGTNDVSAVLPAIPAVILIMLSVVLTLLGGLIPSKKAAKSDPVTALRTE